MPDRRRISVSARGRALESERFRPAVLTAHRAVGVDRRAVPRTPELHASSDSQPVGTSSRARRTGRRIATRRGHRRRATGTRLHGTREHTSTPPPSRDIGPPRTVPISRATARIRRCSSGSDTQRPADSSRRAGGCRPHRCVAGDRVIGGDRCRFEVAGFVAGDAATHGRRRATTPCPVAAGRANDVRRDDPVRRRDDSFDRVTNPHRCRSAAGRLRDQWRTVGSGERVRVARRCDDRTSTHRSANRRNALAGCASLPSPRIADDRSGSAVPGRASTPVRAQHQRAARGLDMCASRSSSEIPTNRRGAGVSSRRRSATGPSAATSVRRSTDAREPPRRSQRVAQLGPGGDRPVDGLEGTRVTAVVRDGLDPARCTRAIAGRSMPGPSGSTSVPRTIRPSTAPRRSRRVHVRIAGRARRRHGGGEGTTSTDRTTPGPSGSTSIHLPDPSIAALRPPRLGWRPGPHRPGFT